MKRKAPHGFTIIEMLTVVAVIVILMGLVISVSTLVQQKGARSRAMGEIKAMSNACDAYKTDNGAFPGGGGSKALDPRTDVNPNSPRYHTASLELYQSLSGDLAPAAAPDGKPESENKSYYTFQRNMLSTTKDAAGNITQVKFIQDPFGNAYGYSTAANELEAEYRDMVSADPKAPRPSTVKGYNPTFDLWSTAGESTAAGQAKWVRNWGE